MNPRDASRCAILAVANAFLLALCVALGMTSLTSPAFAQSADDPNRPPYAQNSVRQTSQHSLASSASASSTLAPGRAVDGPSADEQSLFDHANESRVLAGLPALRWDGQLAAAARTHCLVMVQHEALLHQFAGEPDMRRRVTDAAAGYSALAENVALAATADEIHLAWMRSAGHRANLLDSKLTAVGISVMPGKHGLYAVEDFSLQVGNLSMEMQEARIRDLLTAAGIRTADNPEHTQRSDARRSCLQRDGAFGRPAMVVRFETSDLSKLPDKLREGLAGGKYRSAAVGACDAGPTGGFTRFRLAVLLY